MCKKKIQIECERSDHESDSSKKSSTVPSQKDLPESDINLDLGDSMVIESDDEIVIHDVSNVTPVPEPFNSDEEIEMPAKIEQKDEGVSEVSRSISPHEKFKSPEPFSNKEKQSEIIYRKQHIPSVLQVPEGINSGPNKQLPIEPEEKNDDLLASIKKFVDTLTPDNSVDMEKSCSLKIDSDSDEDIFVSQDKENKLNECLICGFVGKNDDDLLEHLQSSHIDTNQPRTGQHPSKPPTKFTLTCLRCHQAIRADERSHVCKPIRPLVKVVSRPKLIDIPKHAPRINSQNPIEQMTSFGSTKAVVVPHPQYDQARRTISAMCPEKKKYPCFAQKRKHDNPFAESKSAMMDDSSLKMCKSDHSTLEAYATKIFSGNGKISEDSMQMALHDFVKMSMKSQKSLLDRMRPPIREGSFPSYNPHPFFMASSRVRTTIGKETFRLLVEPFVCVNFFYNQSKIFGS